MENPNKECLSLKVLRLTKPYFVMENPLLLEEHDFAYVEFCNSENTVKSSGIPLDEILGLPTSFGNIYLGETFSSYVTVINDSSQMCRDISIKISLQTTSQQIPLNNNNQKPVAQLEPGQSIDDVIYHEVKELGNHILICNVSYGVGSPMEKLFFKKFYKFMVSKPLDVKTKFYSEEDNEIFMEAQIHNITGGSIFLERVALEPSIHYSVHEINANNNRLNDDSISGFINCLKPNNTRQYLYRLIRRDPINVDNKASLNQMGRLDIVWRTQMGERGRLQTSNLVKSSSPHADLKFTLLRIPSETVVGEVFSIVLKLENTSERNLELIMTLNNPHFSGLVWNGCIKKNLGTFIPSTKFTLELELIPTISGLQSLSGLKLTDTFMRREYEFNDFAQILILNK